MAPLVTEWTSGGTPWSVTTEALESETAEQHERRHQEAVGFWQEQAPPD